MKLLQVMNIVRRKQWSGGAARQSSAGFPTRRQWFAGAAGAAIGGTALAAEAALRPTSAYAQTGNFVDITSNQTIGGIKTFAQPPVVPPGTFALAQVPGTAMVAANVTGPFAPSTPGAAAPTRYVGGTSSGAPTTGTFAVGDFVIDQTAKVWICTGAGTPGTWAQQSGSGVDLSTDQTVGGVKTFTAAPVVPTDAFPQAAVAGLVDDLAGKEPTIAPGTYADAAVTTAAFENVFLKSRVVDDQAGEILFRLEPTSHPDSPVKLNLGSPLIAAMGQSVYDPTLTFGFHSDTGGAQNLLAFEYDFWTDTGFDGQWHHQCEQHSLFFGTDGIQRRPWSWSGHYATGEVDFGIFADYFSVSDPSRQVLAFTPGSTLKIYRDIELSTGIGFKTAQVVVKGNSLVVDAAQGTLPGNGSTLTLAGGIGSTNKISFGSGSGQRWLIYDSGSKDALYIRDTVNGIQHIVLAAFPNSTYRYTYINSKLQVAMGLGVFGHVPPATQPATPSTLAEVIALLRSYGLCT